MKFSDLTSDDVVLKELGTRLMQVRLEHNMTQAQLATKSGLSKRTIERLEKGNVATQLSGFVRVCRTLALIDRFEQLLPEPLPSPIDQLRMMKRQRQRASSRKPLPPDSSWKWGDEK